MEFHIKLVLLKKFLTQNVSNTDSLYHRPKRRKKHRGRTSPLDCLDVFNFDLALTLIGFAGCITLINATEHTGSNEIITLSQNIAQSPRNIVSENNSNARNTQLTKDNGDESLDVPFPARSFHDKVTDTRPVDDMVVSFAQKAQPPVVHKDKIVARVGDIIHANPLLKLLNMFQHDADQQSVVDITKPDWYRELVMLPSTDHLPALKRSLTKQPTESSTPLSNGKETLTFFDRFGSDAAVAKAYASLTESRTSHGTEDNFDEIYQIFNATMFHDAIPKENIIENVKQPYPPLPLLYGTTQIDLPSITTTKSTTVIPDLITSIMTNSYSSTISPTWPETASTPFNHTLFDQQMLATTITALATASSLSTSTPSTTRRYSPKSTIRKNRLLTTTNLALINTSSNITGTTTRISRVPPLVTTKFPLSTTPTASPGKFHTEDPLGNRTRPVSSWSIELESETPPFEITESLETALSTVPTTTKLNSKSTRMDWWFLRTTTPKPTTTQQASPQITTHVPLKTQSVTNPPVMMQQEAYPAKELVSSKNQIYPWERQRELLVPFSESARAGKGPQLQFNDKNISVDTWTTTKSPEVHSPPTLRPFPPVMPGASFYVDQHVSHGHFGREAGTMPVVYDPNVLQSRYGFSGMLPLSHMPKEHTNKLLVDIQPTYHQKKIRKPTTFGVQNLPIGYTPHSKVRFPVTNQYFVDFSKAAYFFIPPPVKLSTAKAIKIRAQSRPSFVIGTVPPVTWTSTPTTTVASTTTSETQRTMAMFGDHLNWRPLGTGPRKFGPAKLIPLAESERNPELNQNGLVEENKFAEKSGTTTERRIDIESYDDFSSKGSSKCLREDPMHLDDLSPALIPAVKACFIRTRECLLHEVTPLERRINFNEEQCINFCGQHAYCNSVVYSKSMAICDIFNLRNGTGNAHLVHHHDYHYYEPKQWANGTKAIEDCWQENAPPNMPKAAEIPSAVLVDSSDFFPTARGLTNVNSTSDDSDPLLQANLTHEIPKDMCPADKDIIVFKSSGYKLRDTSQATHDKNSTIAGIMVQPLQQLSSETECIFSCLINLARGKMPYECVAATYNSGGTDGQCLLYGSGNDMDGNVHLIPDVAHNHYEKGCITMDLVELCKGYPVVRHPQKTLLGFAMASKHASSFIECIELCFADRQRAVNNRTLLEQKGNTCKSIMYFYEETTSNNCILNSENKDTAPAFFVDENEALVDYASFESCYTVDTGTTADDINGRNLGSGNSNDINVPSSLQPIDEPEGETQDEISNAEENTRRSPATLQGSEDKLTNKEKYSESSASRSDETDNGKQIQTHSVKNFYPTPPMARIPPILGVLPGLLRIDSDNAQEQSSAYAKPSLGVERAPRRNIKRNKKTKTTQKSDNRMGNSLPFNGSKSVELKPRESQRRRTRQRVRNILRNSIHRV